MDQHGLSWTVILHPEKRKVGSSTLPLTTTTRGLVLSVVTSTNAI